jgi:hypothetical protein
MKTAQELRQLRIDIAHADPNTRVFAVSMAVGELLDDLIARREATEGQAVATEAEALRARILAECRMDQWTTGAVDPESAVTLVHRPTGRSAAAPRRDAALDYLIGQLREIGYFDPTGREQT